MINPNARDFISPPTLGVSMRRITDDVQDSAAWSGWGWLAKSTLNRGGKQGVGTNRAGIK
jgi:hypothetical protein